MKRLKKPVLLQSWIQPWSCFKSLSLDQIPLPVQCYILGLVRDQALILADQNPVIQVNDYVLAVALEPMYAPHLEVILDRIQTHDRCLLR